MADATKRREPTLRQRAFVKALADPTVPTKRAAALQAGYSPAGAASMATHTANKPNVKLLVKQAIQERLDKASSFERRFRRLEKLQNTVEKRLSSLLEDPSGMSLAEIGATSQLLSTLTKDAVAIKQMLPDADEDERRRDVYVERARFQRLNTIRVAIAWTLKHRGKATKRLDWLNRYLGRHESNSPPTTDSSTLLLTDGGSIG